MVVAYAKWQMRLFSGESAMHQEFAEVNFFSYLFLIPVFGLCCYFSSKLFPTKRWIPLLFLFMFVISVVRLVLFMVSHI